MINNKSSAAEPALIFVILLIVIIMLGAIVYLTMFKKSLPIAVQPTTSPVATPTPDNISETWKIDIPVAGIDLRSGLEKSSVIIADKNKKHVTVYEKNLENNSLKMLLEFDESLSFDNSGNYWSGLPPSIALSPDEKLIAFVDENGPKIYNIENKEIVLLAVKIGNNKEDNLDSPENTPKWSNPNIFDVYDFYTPQWSFDGQYISFKEALYEGSATGIFKRSGKNSLWSSASDATGMNCRAATTGNVYLV